MPAASSSIGRERALEAFHRYVAPYDPENPRIALKIDHTLRVAELCDSIARGEGFTPAGCDLAWLCGLLHDIGRFEQVRRWGTFYDAQSASHAALGGEILFGTAFHKLLASQEDAVGSEGAVACQDDTALKASADAGDETASPCPPLTGSAPTGAQAAASEPNGFSASPATGFHAPSAEENAAFAEHVRACGSIRAFCDDPSLDALVAAAVGFHSAHHLPDGLPLRTRMFCNVTRDADKIDILRVACTDSVETVIGVSPGELLASAVSPAVEEAFFEHRTIAHAERETPADFLVSLACFTYELVFPTSLEIAVEQGHIFAPFEHPFGITDAHRDPATRMLMNRMDGHLRCWVDERLGD